MGSGIGITKSPIAQGVMELDTGRPDARLNLHPEPIRAVAAAIDALDFRWHRARLFAERLTVEVALNIFEVPNRQAVLISYAVCSHRGDQTLARLSEADLPSTAEGIS